MKLSTFDLITFKPEYCNSLEEEHSLFLVVSEDTSLPYVEVVLLEEDKSKRLPFPPIERVKIETIKEVIGNIEERMKLVS